ncbi:hypothetical protein GCM10009665_30090 [Kitasatospora nipponensis]|uniref:Uncharacterized protein n=1 Tax=Kitasatospora nipponensis TaxID=258049 RepID=A0ABP4GTH0_9ACTN
MAGAGSGGPGPDRSEGSGRAPGGSGAGLTGGLSGGEWWRVDGPWRVLGTPPGGQPPDREPGEDGVYLAEPAVHRSVPPPPLARPGRGPAPGAAAGPEVPRQSGARSIFRKRPAPAPGSGPDRPVEPAAAAAAWLIAPASPVLDEDGPVRPPTLADFPGWSEVSISYPPDDTLPPEPAADEADQDEPVGQAAPVPGRRRWRRRGAPQPVAEPGAAVGRPRGPLTGRRPSPLLLLAALVLVGGTVTGLIPVLAAGWVLTYFSQALGDLAKKFAVFGVPMVCMTGSTLWFWGRAQHRWGAPLAQGAPLTHATVAALPGVLRLAAALSAVFLLALTLRRRAAQG